MRELSDVGADLVISVLGITRKFRKASNLLLKMVETSYTYKKGVFYLHIIIAGLYFKISNTISIILYVYKIIQYGNLIILLTP